MDKLEIELERPLPRPFGIPGVVITTWHRRSG